MNFPVRCYHPEQAEAKYHLRISCWKNSDLTIDETYQAEKKTHLRGDKQTSKNEYYSCSTESIKIIKGTSCEINCNLQPDECTVRAVPK